MIDNLRYDTISSVYALIDNHIAMIKVYKQNPVNIISKNLINNMKNVISLFIIWINKIKGRYKQSWKI